jgi:ectoine hydroxylase-related dioxygenase (phytanoyl-CoA dioxygenase family)
MKCVLLVSDHTILQMVYNKVTHKRRLEMEPGSILIFLGSCYHGGGHNSTANEMRKVHGLFFIRGTLRTEENQFLAVSRSTVMTMSDKMLSLLGYKKPTTVLGVVDNMDPSLDLKAAFKNILL